MPKGNKTSSSQHSDRSSRTILVNDIPRQYQYSTTPTMQSQGMSQPGYATGGPVQPLQYQQIPQPAPLPVRASSGAWTPQDDATLMQARAQGLNWQPIQQTYFPTKTPNACRKRHERLMDRRNSDDWDVIKLENLAKEYMNMRKEIWGQLGAKTGEKWTVVEAKCMSSGLKNLQSAARACSRRERLESGAGSSMLSVHGMHHGGHHSHPYSPHATYSPREGDMHGHGGGGQYDNDDSAIGLEELEAEYAASSAAESGSYGHSPEGLADDARGAVRTYPGVVGGVHSATGYDGREYAQQGGMMQARDPRDARGERGYATHSHGMQGRHPGQYGMQHGVQRLPSIDMGIGAIINRPNNGL